MSRPAYYREMWIPEGKAGTRATLYQMREVAVQDSRQSLVQQLAQTYPSPIFIEQFFRMCWDIVPDPENCEYVRAPRYQVECYLETGRLEGDCDDAAVLASSMLRSIGWPSFLIAIRMPGQSDFSHVFCSAVQDGFRVSIDPIVPAGQLPITDMIEVMTMPV